MLDPLEEGAESSVGDELAVVGRGGLEDEGVAEVGGVENGTWSFVFGRAKTC